MAWTAPLTAVANATLTAAQWNASVRDNLNETAPAKATTAGRFFVTAGVNSIAERAFEADEVATSQTTTSTSFTNLATTGPAVTLTTGVRVFIFLTCRMSNNGGGQSSGMGYETSGATTAAASLTRAVEYESSNANDMVHCSHIHALTVTAGSNTFTAKYLVSAGTGTFDQRRIAVLPIG